MALTPSFSVLITPCMLFFLDEGDGLFMWTAPLPAWNQTVSGKDPRIVHTAITSVAKGSSNVTLQWSYTLLHGQEIWTTNFAIYDGVNPPQNFGVVWAGRAVILDRNDYKTRFIIKCTYGECSLIIKTLTERENVTFQCRVLLTDGSQWAYNIRTEVTDKPYATGRGENTTVFKGENAQFSCPVDGNPEPIITWYNGSEASGTKISSGRHITASEGGCYTCSGTNFLGNSDPVTQCLTVIVEPTSTTRTPETTTEGNTIWEITVKVNERDCTNFRKGAFWVKCETVLGGLPVKDVDGTTRCDDGVFVYLVLKFNQSVKEKDVTDTLKTAACENKFGEFTVDPNSIKVTTDSHGKVTTDIAGKVTTDNRGSSSASVITGSLWVLLVSITAVFFH